MRRLILVLTAVAIVGVFGLWAATKTSEQKVKREPLQKSGFELKSPSVYQKRIRLESGKQVTDPKPRVDVVDARAGKYEFKWIGYDGTEKIIAYQSPDAVDVVVSSAVEKSTDGNYVYSYIVDILSSSATSLYSFGLQNFSDDTRPVEINDRPTTLADLRIFKEL